MDGVVVPNGQNSPAKLALLGLIRVYQSLISAGLPPACRFEPTCSRYAYAAIERYGVLRGAGLAARRLLRCHPWGGSGYDPVP
jgi:putative membrane protein insertion efficiency factor